MARPYEKAIIEPSHAAFGYPWLSLIGLLSGAFFIAFVNFPIGLATFAIVHAVSVLLRSRAPHGEDMFLRQFQARKSIDDWAQRRRIYFG